MRRYLAPVTPSRRVSIGIWVFALIVDVWVPLTARETAAGCGDGYTATIYSRVIVVSFVVLPTLFALWRCLLHFADEPSRRPMIAAVTVVLVAAAVAGVAAGLAGLNIGSELTARGDC